MGSLFLLLFKFLEAFSLHMLFIYLVLGSNNRDIALVNSRLTAFIYLAVLQSSRLLAMLNDCCISLRLLVCEAFVIILVLIFSHYGRHVIAAQLAD